jgi:uncharacterized membrane protein
MIQIVPPFAFPKSADHIHPILVNFTAALVPASWASDVAGRLTRRRSLHNGGWWMLLYAAILTPFTALAGLEWKKSVSDAVPPALLRMHQFLGVSLAVALCLLALWRWRLHTRQCPPTNSYLLFTSVVVLALIYQGSIGGAMLFGS